MLKETSSDIPTFTVILTATINPGEYKTDLNRNDPRTRLLDYKRSLLFWARLKEPRLKGVVFCENSRTDLSPFVHLAEQFDRPVEFLNFSGNKKPPKVHYGYSELGIIDYVFEKSKVLHSCPYFIKATGRLTFPKISRLLDTLRDFDAVIDHRRKYRNETGSPVRARTQLMLFSKEFYFHHFFGRREEMIGNYSHIEEFIAEKLGELPESARIMKRFKVECQPAGFSAFDNKNYNSLDATCKSIVRALTRRLFPSLWI